MDKNIWPLYSLIHSFIDHVLLNAHVGQVVLWARDRVVSETQSFPLMELLYRAWIRQSTHTQIVMVS